MEELKEVVSLIISGPTCKGGCADTREAQTKIARTDLGYMGWSLFFLLFLSFFLSLAVSPTLVLVVSLAMAKRRCEKRVKLKEKRKRWYGGGKEEMAWKGKGRGGGKEKICIAKCDQRLYKN